LIPPCRDEAPEIELTFEKMVSYEESALSKNLSSIALRDI
jgi:hypothetical protein